ALRERSPGRAGPRGRRAGGGGGRVSVTRAVGVESSRLPYVDADVLVAPFFADDRPLRGPAAWADWRLCGLLDDAVAAGRLPTGLGEATLAPSGGRRAAPRGVALRPGPPRPAGGLPAPPPPAPPPPPPPPP